MDGGGDMGGFDMGGGGDMGGYGDMSILQNASNKTRLEQATAEFSVDNSKETHEAEFKKRTGLTTTNAYMRMFGYYMILLFGWVAAGLAGLDYLLFYGEYNLEFVVLIQTTQRALEGIFVFAVLPLLGRVADRVGRKNIMLIGMGCRLLYVTQLTFFPRPVWLILLTTPLFAMGSVSDTIRTGYFRDIFSKETWEKGKHGGVTGIWARFGIFIGFWTIFCAIVNFVLLAILQNELTKCRCPKDSYIANRTVTVTPSGSCTEEYTESCADEKGGVCEWPNPKGCVVDLEPGTKYCKNSGSYFQGGVYTAQFINWSCEILAQIYWYFVIPETLRPTEKTEATVKEYVKERKCDSKSMPWNNLRPLFATSIQRVLMIVVFGLYVNSAAGYITMAWFQEKHSIDSLGRGVIALISGVPGVVWALCVLPILVDRVGDYRGIWLPVSFVLSLQALLYAFLPPQNGQFGGFAIIALICSAQGLGAGAEGLLLKLVPMDVQATVKSGRASLLGVVRIVAPFIWYGIYFNISNCHSIESPMRSLHFIIIGLICLIAFCVLVYFRKDDPQKALKEGRGLEAFYNSDYAKGPWFQYHSSGNYEAFVKEYGDKAAETAMTVTLPPKNQVVVSSAPVVVVNSAPVIVQQPPVIVQQSTPVIVKQEISKEDD